MQKSITTAETEGHQQAAVTVTSPMQAPGIDHGFWSDAELQSCDVSDQETTLVTMLQNEALTRRRHAWGAFSVSAALMVGIVAMLPILASSTSESFGLKIGICFAMLFGIGGVMTASLTRRSYRNKKSLTDHLARVSAKTHIGALVRALKVDGKSVKNIAKKCLIELLPQLNAGDSELLGERERDILIRALTISPHDKGYRDLTELWSKAAERREIAFRVAILKAYEQIGGARELPLVARLAEELPVVPRFLQSLRADRSLNRMGPEIAQAAAECLPYLQLRANEELASGQLLRASSADSTLDRSLLRPAASELEIPSDQLLRPAEIQ